MKKLLGIFLIVLLVSGAALGGVYFYFSHSKSPAAVATRTLANLQNVESASMNMQVDTDVRTEAGILEFLGIRDPETTITMNYEIDAYKNPSLLHANVSISAFDIEALKDLEAVIAAGNDETVQYFRLHDKWYRYVVRDKQETGDASYEASVIQETGYDKNASAVQEINYDEDVSASQEFSHDEDVFEAQNTSPYKVTGSRAESDATEVVDFEEILEGIADGSLSFTMRDAAEQRNGKECYVYDIDLTGDRLEKIIRLSGNAKALIPKLRPDEHVNGQLFIDSKESLPEALDLAAGDIISEQLNFEAIGTSFSVTNLDIKVDVKGYNIGTVVNMPDEYIDVNNLESLGVQQWLSVALDLTGLGIKPEN